MELLKLDIQMFANSDGKIVISTELDTKNFENGINMMQNKAKSGGASIKSIVAGLGITKLIGAAFNTISNSMDDAIKRVDTMNNFANVMGNLGISAEASDKSIKKMADKLAGLPTTLDAGALAVQRFASKNSDVEKSTDIFLALNNAIIAGGASADIQSTALEQLSQAYSKGKPDMMEWRSIQTAMPAQLKQVAMAMGYAGGNVDALGEDLRKGNVSMDDFMDTIIKLNKQGVKGFKNFEQQARSATGGIGNSIIVAKTQVVKGVASIINSLEKGLSKSGTSISKIFSEAGKTAKVYLDKIAKTLENINWAKLFDTIAKALKVLIPLIAGATTAFITYHTALKAIEAINLAKNIISATSAILGLTQATELAGAAQKIYNAIMAVNPWVLAATAVAGLTVALITLSKAHGESTSALEKEIKKTSEAVAEYNNSMNELSKTRDKTLKETASELGNYKDLWHELQSITDVNGRVKEGYEDRAKTITGVLSEALGLEIKMIDGQIQGYDTLGKKIDDVIAKKRAEAFINANKEIYEKALKSETDLWKKVEDATEQAAKAKKDYEDALKKVAKETGLTTKEIEAYNQGLVNSNDLTSKHKDMTGEQLEALLKSRKELKKVTDTYAKANDALLETNATYEDNQKTIKKYQDATTEFANKNYKNVEKILNDTVNFTKGMATINKQAHDEAIKQNNDAYTKLENGLDQHLQYMQDHRNIYSQEEIDAFKKKKDAKLEEARKERDEANRILDEQYKSAKEITKKGTDEEIKTIKSKKGDFQQSGKENITSYAQGLANAATNAKNGAKSVASAAVGQLNKYGDAHAQGKNTSQGFADGISSLISSIKRAASAAAGAALGAISSVLAIRSPSKKTREIGEFFDKGFALGIKDEKNNTLKVVESLGSDALKELDGVYSDMQNAVDLETSKMTASVQTSGTYQMAMANTPTFNLQDNSKNTHQLVVDGKVLAEVVNTENKNREVAKA